MYIVHSFSCPAIEISPQLFFQSRHPCMNVLPDDENLARQRDWLIHCPKFIQRAYKRVTDIDWLCPCVLCSSKTQRLALVTQSPLKRRTVAYVCNDCISHRRFVRIRRRPANWSPSTSLEVGGKETPITGGEEVEEEGEDGLICPMIRRWCAGS